MKLSLDCVGYGGYFTDGEHITAEESLHKAAAFGYDAITTPHFLQERRFQFLDAYSRL